MRSPPAREALEGRLSLGELRDSHREIILTTVATTNEPTLAGCDVASASVHHLIRKQGRYPVARGGWLQLVSGDFIQDQKLDSAITNR